MAKQPKTPSGKNKSRSKSDEDVVEAEVVNEETTDPVEHAAEPVDEPEVSVETVPEDSDFNMAEASEPEEVSAEGPQAETEDSDPPADTIEENAEPAADDTPIEDVADEEPAPDPEPAAVVAAPPPEKPSLFGSVLGGAIAAGIGFVAAMLIFPQGWEERDDSALKAVEAGLADQQALLEDQKVAIQAVSGDVASLSDDVSADLGALKDSTAANAESVAALDARLSALTKSDGTTKLPDDVQILLNTQKAELDALREEVAGLTAAAKAQMEAATAQQEDAEQAEARVKARSALQKVRLALVSGEPFADALPDIAGAVDLPDGLVAVAENGVPTPQTLQSRFPDAARAALAVSLREETGDNTRSRLQLFFKDQLGARSLTPRDGDDADAVLSRAEAAVQAENYQEALTEIEALPEAAQAAFSDWRATAEARIGAVAGYETVSDALNGN